MKKFFLIFCMLMASGSISAQTTSGTDFWVNFFFNLGGDSMFVIVAAPNAANVTVEMPASTFAVSLSLAVGELRKVYIPSAYEPSGADSLTKFGIHVSSDQEISVYAISAAAATTDATCVIPESSIPVNPEFLISTHVSTGGTNARPNVISIVPHDSNTVVEITPSSATSSGRAGGVSFLKTLHKGDVFIVRNNVATGLEGSTIKVISAGKKVSVYQGNDCIMVNCGACDHLYEVVPPTTVLGKRFVLTPFMDHGNGYRYNIMSTKDSNVIFRNGVPVDTILLGNQYEEYMPGDTSLCITTSRPSVVMQMMVGCHQNLQGDPAYLYVVPLEQTITSAIVSTSNTPLINTHFVNILLPKPGIQRFYLDGIKVPASSFTQVYCGDFYFYSDSIQPGSHTIQCDDGFIANIYGMGGYESYAYFAGAALKNLEIFAEYKIVPNCDSGILVEFTPNPDTLTRYKWTFPPNAISDSDTFKNPTVYFPVAGDFKVKLAGFSSELGRDSTELIVHVIDTTAKDFINFDSAILCKDSFVLNIPGSDAYDFIWNTGETGSEIVVKTTGTYSVIGKNKFSDCSIYDTCVITMHDKLVVDFSYHMDKFCPGYPMSLYDSSKLINDIVKSWEWFADFESFSQKQNDTLKSPRANNYDIKLKVTTGKGCVDSSEQRISIDDFPVAKFNIEVKDSCANRGSYIGHNLSSLLLGSFKKFTWEYSDGTLSNSSVIFKNVKDTGLYWLRFWAESDKGCVDTAERQYFKVYPGPIAQAALVDSNICLLNNDFTFVNNTIENEPLFYIWDWGDGAGTVLKNPPPKTYSDTGEYNATFTAGFVSTGCTDTLYKDLKVYDTPSATLVKDSFNECLGHNYFAFTDISDAKGADSSYYRWIWGDGTETVGVKNPIKKFSSAGNYKLMYIFSSGKGCYDTTYKNMNVYTSPIADFDIVNGRYCQRDNRIELSNTSIGPANIRYNWDFGNSTTSVLKSPSPLSYVDTGSYAISLKVLDPLIQCRDTFERVVNILRNPRARASVDDTLVCVKGNSFNFEDTAYQLFAGAQYKWLYSDGDSALTKWSIKSFKTPGVYKAKSIVYNGPFCSDTSEVEIKIGASTQSEINTNSKQFCENENPIELEHKYISGPAVLEYSWKNYSDRTATITKQLAAGGTIVEGYILNTEECWDTALQLIQIVSKPTSQIANGKADKQCLFNNEFEFIANTMNGTNPYQYQWLIDGNNTSSNNLLTYSYPSPKSDIIALITIDSNMCSDTIYYPVEVFEQAEVDFEIDSICPGEPIFLNAIVNPQGIANLKFDWDLGDGTKSSSNPVEHTYAGSNVSFPVQVIAGTPNGCADTSEVKNIVVHEKPLARFSFTVLEPKSGAIPYEFRDSSLNANSYSWTVGNTAYSSSKFVHNFKNVGQQQVILWVENNAGCSDSISQNVLVESPSRIFIPNSFTPNNDGRNETFGPESLAPVKEYYFAVFNRWGEKLFETEDPSVHWEGKYNGQAVMQGSYMYMVNLVFQNESRYKTEGQVTLLR